MWLVAKLMSLALFVLTFEQAIAQSAQDSYPNRLIRIVVPFAPGGTTDIVARTLSEELRNILGQPVIVENKPGADGIIAIQELLRTGADGYTLMIGNVATNAVGPLFHAGKLPFAYDRDVVPVMRLVDIPAVLVATTRNFPPQSLSELIAYAREHPGEVNYGTPGIGNYVHYDLSRLPIMLASPHCQTYRPCRRQALRASARSPGKACSHMRRCRARCSRRYSRRQRKRLVHRRCGVCSSSRLSISSRQARWTRLAPGSTAN
jgi:hypothetical protein